VVAFVVGLVEIDADEADVAVFLCFRVVGVAGCQLAIPAEPDAAARAQCAEDADRQAAGRLVALARASDAVRDGNDPAFLRVRVHRTSSQTRLSRTAALMIPAML